jgi:hypothetical protein
MRWGDTIKSRHRACPLVPDTIIGCGCRFRDPAVQVEIESRVVIYTEQVEQHGHIRRWLPRLGSGKSARGRRQRHERLARLSNIF